MVFSSRNRELFGIIFVFIILLIGFGELSLSRERFVDIFSLGLPIILGLFFLMTHMAVRYQSKNADATLLPIAFLLTGIGILFISRIDPEFASKQLLWISLGLAMLILTIRFVADYERLAEYKYTFGTLGIIFLLIPIFLGKEIGGAKLWLQFGGYSFQPAEIAKIFIVIFLAAYLSEKKDLLNSGKRMIGKLELPDTRHFAPLIFFWIISLLILIFEKDLGSSLLFFGVFLLIVYVSTANIIFTLSGMALFIVGATVSYLSFSHVQTRIDIWINSLPNDVSGSSYQLAQSLFALSAGGMSGTGLGGGLLGTRIHMPAVLTDFIFSSLGEELGLAGTAAIVLIYFYLLFRGLKIGISQKNEFGRLLSVGLIFFLTLQAFIIIGGVIKLIPLTGVTLPLISYGGSSIVANFILIGILMSMSNKAAADG